LEAGAKVDKIWERGLGGVVGSQKGAAAVRLNFKDKSLLFITSHFSRECARNGLLSWFLHLNMLACGLYMIAEI
jgi:hypothetical protein